MAQPRASTQDGSLLGEHRADSIAALDALAEADLGVTPAAPAAGATPTPPAPGVSDEAAKAAADAAAKEAADKAATEAAAKVAADAAAEAAKKQAAAPNADDEAAKAAADKAAADAAAAAANAQPWDKIELPPHSSAKAGESFKALKEAAAKEAARLKAELDAANKAVQDFQAQLKSVSATPKMDPKTEAEIAELRQFKLAHDVESDPEFKNYSAKLTANDEAIWAKLKASGLFTDENLAAGKQVGTKDLDWDKVLPKLGVADRRFIEAKLVDNVNVEEAKATALTAAKANAKTFIETRSSAQMETMKAAATSLIKDLPSFARKDIPATASAAEKAAIALHNQYADTAVAKLNESIALGVTPEAVIELAAGTALAYQYAEKLKAVNAEKAGFVKQIADLTAAKDKAEKELADIKGSESPRGGGAPRYRPAAGRKADVNTLSPSDALDALAAEEAAAAAGNV